jgi:CheY-like chemotaxis protein
MTRNGSERHHYIEQYFGSDRNKRGDGMLQEESNKPLPAEQQTTAKTILVVEDDEDTSEFMALLISTATTYHYYLVPDASEAIHVVKGIKPDLFILDYRLTGMNGLELYDLLHATPGLEAIPAILVTAVRLEALRPEIEKRQVTAFEKPFDLDEFLLTFQRLLGEARSEKHADEGRS